jgi:hypothetical protein
MFWDKSSYYFNFIAACWLSQCYRIIMPICLAGVHYKNQNRDRDGVVESSSLESRRHHDLLQLDSFSTITALYNLWCSVL